MTTNKWNVYKIFSNGKTAKKPCFEFVYDNEDAVFSYFESNIKPTMPPKFQKYKFQVLKEGVEPEVTSNSSSENDAITQKRSKVLQRYLRENENILDFGNSIDFALMLASETDWKWQWTAVQRVTNTYLLGISPVFTSYNKAVEWVDSQM